jgi:Sulfotransferase family
VERTPSRPWYRRVPDAAGARTVLRSWVFGAMRRIFSTNDGRTLAADALRGELAWRPLTPVSVDGAPYPDVGHAGTIRLARRSPAVFITARFRSGSTLLWNIFRHVKGCTAYYEPLNERRWFDPRTRGGHVDRTHRGVDDYWQEYLGLEALGAVYREDWIARNLYMDASSWDPGLLEYVSRLIEAAPGRAVLQFNRIDFRLPWFRHMFPAAKLIHLYRHPRDQWCSSLVRPRSVPRDVAITRFDPYDHFYLRGWARDLSHRFPFLDERVEPHPYRLFYYLWKLSYLYGVTHADLSLGFEALVASPDEQIRQLMVVAEIEDYDIDVLSALVTPIPAGRWQEYADESWFRDHEEACEAVLRDFFLPSARDRR